jgi:predicted ATPase
MIYLQSFQMPTRDDEENYFASPTNFKVKRTCYTTNYPFGLFRYRELHEFYFADITIFCGNNGSGKSSILNVIAEKLALERTAPYNRSDFFEDYVDLCDYQLDRAIPKGSKIITSDGVFEKVLDIRRINDGIDSKRADLIDEYIAENSPNVQPNLLHGLDDYDRWKRVSDMRNRNRSQSRFLKENLMRNIQERSNGESALSYFVDSIQENALYLLDEPENSLSPQNQLQLKYFIEDSVRNFGCQLVISTHSPFLLSLRGAHIYNIDETPPAEKKWTELDCVKVYHDFFIEQNDKFH